MSVDPSAIFSVIKWIGSLSIEEGKFLYQVPEEVDGLQRDLRHIFAISKYAEEHPDAVSDHDRICIEALRKLTFRSEDVLDTYLVKGIQTKVENSNIFKKFAYTCFNSCSIHQIGNEIEAIQRAINSEIQSLQKFKGIISNISEEGLGFCSADRRLRNEPGRVLVRRDEYIVGIEKEIPSLVDQVLKDDQSPQLGFLAITGTGGAGKTTLAKEIYGHTRVKNRFKSRVMVTVSKEWNAKDILMEMMLQAMQLPSKDEVKNLSQSELVNKLYIFLENTSYLFVIDDIWEKDAWDIISSALPKSYGSKVILTTRNQTLPSAIDRRCFVFEPKVLETKDKYELIHKIAVEGRSNTNIKEFEALALNMAERCSGIPLAVVALAGVLNTKNEIYEWESVSRAIDTHILQGEDYDHIRVESIIALSYYDLPYNVRPCLLYLSVFPEDSIIQSEEAIALWIGEGLVTTKDLDNQQERLKDIGIQFIEELVKRCLVKVEYRNPRGHVEYFKIHDLVGDFCIKKVKEQYFLEVILSNDNQPTSGEIRKIQARRIAFQSLRSDMEAHALYKTEALRSFIQFGSGGPSYFHIENNYEQFCLLRVLFFEGVDLRKEGRFGQVGTLIHLRCLIIRDARDTGHNIIWDHQLEPISNLENLLIFICECTCFASGLRTSFFKKMKRLTQVSFVYYGFDSERDRPDYRIQRMDSLGLENSKSLQTLQIWAGGEWITKEIPSLSQSVQELSLRELLKQQDVEALYQCPSLMFNRLHTLKLFTGAGGSLSVDLTRMEHCSQLRLLQLSGLLVDEEGQSRPVKFPPNLVDLRLVDVKLKHQESFTSIGKLCHLKSLTLWGEHSGQFAFKQNLFLQLEKLELNIVLVEFDGGGEEAGSVLLPCLKTLRLYWMDRLPMGLEHLTSLQELEIFTRNGELAARLKKGDEDGPSSQGVDFHMIQHIPSVNIIFIGNKNRV